MSYFLVFLLSSPYWLRGSVSEPISGAVSVILLRGPSIQLLVFVPAYSSLNISSGI